MSAPKTLQSQILRIFEECESVRTFRFETPADFTFVPGMALKISLPGDPKTERFFSISSSPFEEGYVEITCRRTGGLSGKLFDLAVGDVVTLRGPYGNWLYEESAAAAVLISGGSGIAPMRSMTRYEMHRGRPQKITLFYSARTPADIIFRGDLDRFSKAGVKVHVTITRPEDMKAGESWEGAIGRLDATHILSDLADSRESVFYLCGPGRMTTEIAAGLAAQGVPVERIRYESWGTPK